MAHLLVGFEHFAAERLREQRNAIARTWGEWIAEERRVPPHPELSMESLPDSIADVLGRVADFVDTSDEDVLRADATVVDALHALADRRHREGHRVQELVRELHVLARVLDAACLQWVDAFPEAPAPAAVVRVAGRLNRAPILMGEIGAGAFLALERAERTRLTEQVRGFTEMLAHEMRTPLGAAQMAAGVLESDEMVLTAQERWRFAALIQRNLRRASTLLDDMRSFAFRQAADPAGARWLPLAQVLGAALAEVRELAVRADVQVDVEEPIPPLRVDAYRTELVLLNLIGNAVKYSDPDAAVRRVDVRFREDRDETGAWWLEVIDNGIGIPAEHHARIFERTFRAHPERAEGAGLGLAIVREAVRQLAGTIDVESEPGRGSTFRVRLPAPGQDQENR